MCDLSTKTALIIGGSGGIGCAISKLLSKKVKKLFIHGGHDSPKFDSLVKNLKNNCEISKIIFDFEKNFPIFNKSDLFEISKNVDILIVCYGPFLQKNVDSMSFEEWQKIALLDYALPGILVSNALGEMQKNNFGRILLFGGTGTSHRTEFKTNVAYAGAKSGLNVLVESTATMYAKFGITVNAILPGFTQTEYTTKFDSDLAQKMPLKKQISVDTIAKSALFLLENSNLNGVLFRVDQGWSA